MRPSCHSERSEESASQGSARSRAPIPPAYPERLRFRDALQIASSALMPLFGAAILARLLLTGASPAALPMAYVTGLGFIGLGAYRMKHVIRYWNWRQNRQCPPPE